MTFGSATASVTDRDNQISLPMEQFLKGRDEYFITVKGMVESSFDEYRGTRVWDSGFECGRLEALLEQNFD